MEKIRQSLSLLCMVALSACMPVNHEADKSETVKIAGLYQLRDDQLNPPCKARVVGKSLLEIVKNSQHNSYCAYLHEKQLEEIKASKFKGE